MYAFDTEAAADSKPLWMVNLGPAMPMTDFPTESNFATEIGITGTPFIDRDKQVLYVVSAHRALDASGQKIYAHHLHALSLGSGQEALGGPQQVVATVAGNGASAVQDTVSFDSAIALQRTALLLSGGKVFFGTAAHAYSPRYHGWLFAYDAATLQQVGALNTTSDSAQGGIWMSGGGPSQDKDGLVYVTSGNGLNADPARDFQQSLLQFNPAGSGLVPTNRFTVSDWQMRDQNDLDFGTTSATVVAKAHLLVAGDKLGSIYVVDSQRMKGVQPADQQLFAKIVGPGKGFGLYSAPIYYNDGSKDRLYAWATMDNPRAYELSLSTSQVIAKEIGSGWANKVGMPGGVMSLSANGAVAGSAVLWAAITLSGNASGSKRPGVLVALDAADLTKTLYRSDAEAQRDTLGNLGKFSPPTVANGRVYVATQSNAVAIYGLGAADTP